MRISANFTQPMTPISKHTTCLLHFPQNILFSVLGFFFHVSGGSLLIDRYNDQIYADQGGGAFDGLTARQGAIQI